MSQGKFIGMMNKLQQALAQKDVVVFINKNQFWSDTQHRQINMYFVYETEFDEVKHRRIQHEVLRTPVPVDVVIYLANRYKGLEMLQSLGEVQKHQDIMKKRNRNYYNSEDLKSATAMRAMEDKIVRRNDERFGV